MLSFFPRGVLDEILNLIESVSEGFPSYSSMLSILPKQHLLVVMGRNIIYVCKFIRRFPCYAILHVIIIKFVVFQRNN